MAESVVLAELVIDPTGVERGLARANAAIGGGAGRIQDFGRQANNAANFTQVLTNRMFSLRSAAIALLGAFTFAGVILQIVNLVKELVTATDAWKDFSRAMQDAFDTSVRGISSLEVLRARLGDILKKGGLSVSGFEADQRLMSLSESQKAIEGEIERLKALPVSKNLIGSPEMVERMRQMAVLTESLRVIEEERLKVGKELNKVEDERLKTISEQVQHLIPSKMQTVPLGVGGVPGLFPGLAAEAQPSTGGLVLTDIFGEEVLSGAAQLNESLMDINAGFHELGGIAPPSMLAIATASEGATQQLEAQAIASQTLTNTMQLAGLAAVNAIFGTENASKNLFKSFMKQTAAAMLAMVIQYQAYAVASTTGVGGLTLGGHAGQFLKAAVLFGAAATAAQAIAGGGGGGGGGHGAIAASPEAPPSRNVTVNVSLEGGTLIGSTREEIARDITNLVRRALGDGETLVPQVGG